jgi:UDP-N-acetyl-D-galactosamine dehydrogenase
MLGITFKENCPDIRNTKVIDIYHEFLEYGLNVDVYDPWANPDEVYHEYEINTITEYPVENSYAAIILAVAHKEFLNMNFNKLLMDDGVLYDVKSILPRNIITSRL